MTVSSQLQDDLNVDEVEKKLIEYNSDDDESLEDHDGSDVAEENNDSMILVGNNLSSELLLNTGIVESSTDVQPCLTGSSVALKEHFRVRLEQFLFDLDGDGLEADEWFIHLVRRDGGLNMGLLEVEYVNSKSRKFHSRVEVACFLGLMPSAKNFRSMTREQHYFCSAETRERLLLSQQLTVRDFQADSIHYENDIVTISSDTQQGFPVDDINTCFSFGNIVVLNWGRIVQDAAFHTSSQLYPLGFRCLRQEHDVILDRVVDCLCEIDSVLDVVESSHRTGNERRALLPLFRITVSWILDDGSHARCVYEARTPQKAWQAAMLERVGLDISSENVWSPIVGVVDDASESVDEEETALRVELREQRKRYFRALRTEQSLGLQAAVKPRLSVEAVDSFGDELLLRMIEGMEGSLTCRSYHFLDSRDREAGKKSMLRAFSRMFAKAKFLDKTICRSSVTGGSEVVPAAILVPRKRRPAEDSDSRKKLRTEENKELRSLTAAFVKNRSVRMREMEKGIALLKAAMTRNVKKRREDAKNVVETVYEAEEKTRTAVASMNSSNIVEDCEALRRRTVELAKCSRPEPSVRPVLLQGEIVGAVLEVWEFLSTFAQPLHLLPLNSEVPSIQDLLSAAKARDPAHVVLDSYTRCLQHTFECASTSKDVDSFLKDVSPSAASEVLNRTGMALCGVLVKDFERVMGLDLVEAQAGDLRVPVNELTWREVARVVLLNSLCKEVGMSDADIGTLVKGRGFYTTPESADRKALKLARRRIAFAHTIRDEYQESLFGFGCGHCVRLPAPSVPFHPEDVVWTALIASLVPVPDSNGCLIYEVIQAAASAVSAVDTSLSARRLQKALRDCVDSSVFRLENGGASKQAALDILSSVSASSEDYLEPGELSANQRRFDSVRLVYDFSPDMAPMSSFDLWDKHALDAVRRAKPVLCFEEPGEASRTDALMEMEDTVSEAMLHKVVVGSEAVANKKSNQEESAVIHDMVHNNSEYNDDKQDEEEEEEVEWVAAPLEADFAQAELLSIAMQRCYLVLRDLMTCQQARYFLRADADEVLVSSQPLTLPEIRAFLVSGGYEDSIFSFHCDVTILLENAMAVNLELSPARVAAQKLYIIFERLFFEIVLCWDHPLPFHDSCHACRSVHPVSSSKVAVCDRCEGSYHLQCLTPPLVAPPRSEWYCLPCVEQRGIANAHPCKTADVAHPSDPQALGEVVGIEQLHETVLFVVEFGTLREMWSGRKVRQFALDASSRDVDSRDAEHSQQRQPLVLHLPSGYEIEDYDRVCGVARAYTGWGASRNLVPSVLLDCHSLVAKEKAAGDFMFDNFRRAAAVLAGSGASCLTNDLTGAAEWMVVLRSLLQKALYSSQVGGMIALIDDSVDESTTARLLASVQSGSASLSELQTALGVAFTRGDPLLRNRNAIPTPVLVDDIDDSSSSDDDDLPLFGRRGGQRTRPVHITTEDDEDEDPSDVEQGEFSGAEEDDGNGVEREMRVCEDIGSTSSDEDEDLFDAEGRCLTSGGGVDSALASRSFEEEDWEVRQLSRQKGREDALLTQVLVGDVLGGGLDVEGRGEEAEEGYDLVREELGSFHKGATNCIVKACMGRPSESLVIDDWCLGWQTKMESLMRDHELNSARPDSLPALCELCGSEESYLSSPFVRGFTSAEFEADLLNGGRCDSATNRTLHTLTPAALSGCTGIKGFRARNRALNGLVWLPVDPLDAEIERRECTRRQLPLKGGSLVVHECCADFMHFNRSLTQGQSQNVENNHIVEILAGLGRAKASPLGSDRFGALYWVFANSKDLFVSCSSNSSQRTSDIEMPQACVWRVYSLSSDIATLLSWLDPVLPLERTLKQALSLLFPDSALVSCSIPSLVSDSVLDSGATLTTFHSMEVVDDTVPLSVAASGEGQGQRQEENVRTESDFGDDDEDDARYAQCSDEEEDEEDDEEDHDDIIVRKSGRTRRFEPKIGIRSDRAKKEFGAASASSKDAVLRRGELVLVEANPANRILWEARILESWRANGPEGRLLYKVHFLQWNAAYDGWFDENCILTGAEAAITTRGSVRGGSMRALMHESRAEYVRSRVAEAPALLQSLTAFQFMDEFNRASGPSRVPLTFSDSRSSDVAILRSALLMIEMALPLGAVDESEDRWGDNFVEAWRQAVSACSDASGLMQCQIMLEYGVRTAWLKPAGLKLFSCLPSRALSMRSPTIGLVAMRVWLLDLTVRYDKVQSSVAEKASAGGKGRPASSSKLPPIGMTVKSTSRSRIERK